MARELAIENGKLKSNLDANGNKVANLAPPTSDGDAATKKYVDERPTPPPSWSDITGRPDTFPPEAHTHTKSEITDFPASMPPTAHSHASDNWFTTAIEAVKSWASGAFAAIKHSHVGDSWFTTALTGKLDKTDVVAPTDSTAIDTSKAAQAEATRVALAGKANSSDIPSLSGQTFDISVDAQFKDMCIAMARELGAVVTHTTDDTSTGGQVAQAYGITPTDATTFGELQNKAGLGDSAVLGDL